MTFLRCFAPVVALGLFVGCDATLQQPEKPQPYAPWEAGLTLIYERQDLAPADRVAQRIQVRVEASRPTAEGFDVEISSASLKGQTRTELRLQRGGLAVREGDRVVAELLPDGFPDRRQRWTIGNSTYEVIGRAYAEMPWLKSLPDSARTGVWVEGRSPEGDRQRLFYLPGIGEVETLRWRQGRWEPVLRLVSRGFTDPAPTRPKPMA